MLVPLSGTVVIAFGLFLLGLAALTLVDPARAARFLRLFASSARAHYTEQLLRLIVGVGLVIFSRSMWFSAIFRIFGWIMVVTAIGLLFMPWRWHHRFARWVIPMVIRHLRWFGIGAFALSVLVLYGITRIVLI